MKIWKLVVLPSAVFMAACATQASKDAMLIGQNTKVAVQNAESCLAAISMSADYAPLASVMPVDGADATLSQLANENLASDDEVRAIKVVYPQIQDCQQRATKQIEFVTPSIASGRD